MTGSLSLSAFLIKCSPLCLSMSTAISTPCPTFNQGVNMGLFCEKKAWQHKHKQYQAWHWIQCWLRQTIQTITVLFFWDSPSSNSKFIILFIYISTLTFWSRCKYSCSMFNVQSAHIHHRQRHSWPAFHSKGRWGRQGTSVTLNVTADDRCHPPSVRFIWLCPFRLYLGQFCIALGGLSRYSWLLSFCNLIGNNKSCF